MLGHPHVTGGEWSVENGKSKKYTEKHNSAMAATSYYLNISSYMKMKNFDEENILVVFICLQFPAYISIIIYRYNTHRKVLKQA
ncbi:hypothetical protein SporoP37_05280 [Sporosarcina sp. P37]|uniref:hypothetical protein n=1 Tax=unclassified Sporosarcina TaxID=2647733 RepID=UPI000A17F7C8|nr:MULTISPECIES: hypothetical protein [unclassified Sporosarcina]ARK24153.1 hypothetical protein SporoP37_05280 [Sporosarcina sp. P37]PID17428.1 hypothetical protein CSV62_13715 [Sporosarcina sp. P35]